MHLTAAQPINPPEFLQLLGNEIRWQLVQALARTDMHVQELVKTVQRPQNLVSYHLRKLYDSGMVRESRSIADGREIYYSLDVERMRAAYAETGQALTPALDEPALTTRALRKANGEKVHVLFLCTHNSARSQIAEGLLRAKSNGQVAVYSAGTEATQIHPLAIQAMAELNIDIQGQHSKSLDQFIGQNFDYIITVCDRAKESCPVFPGDPVRIHWSFPDPAAVVGPERVRYQAFKQTSLQMMARVNYLLMMIQRRLQDDRAG